MEEHINKLNKAAREFIAALRQFQNDTDSFNRGDEEQFDDFVQEIIDKVQAE
jgi:methionyl-tRNA synthetase